MDGSRMIGAARRAARRGAASLRTGRSIDAPLRFAVREERGSPEMALYRLRGTGRRVWLRHGTGDAGVLREIFTRRDYEPPPPVTRALDGVGPLQVADLGGNVGLFALFALDRFPGSSVVSFEPDPDNAEVLRRNIAANGFAGRWRLVEACAASADGVVPFHAGHAPLSCRATDGDEEGAITVEARDALPVIAEADLVKIDIEGGEWELLADPRLRETRARALVLEFHRGLCPGDDPAGLADRLLVEAGFRVRIVHEWPQDDEPTDQTGVMESAAGRLWAWRTPGSRPG